MTLLCIIGYLFAIVIANASITMFGPIALPVVSFLLIAFDLVCRAILHEKWKNNHLWIKMILLISSGSLLSYISCLATARIATASAVAFALMGSVDTAVYSMLGNHSKMIRINGSNLASALVDSLLFPVLAFGSFMPLISILQTSSKVVGGLLWCILFLQMKRIMGSHDSNNKKD